MTNPTPPELERLADEERAAAFGAVKAVLASLGVLAPALAAVASWRAVRRERRALAAALFAGPRDEADAADMVARLENEAPASCVACHQQVEAAADCPALDGCGRRAAHEGAA